jgi:hypothetical protein
VGHTREPSVRQKQVGHTREPSVRQKQVGHTREPSVRQKQVGHTREPSVRQKQVGHTRELRVRQKSSYLALNPFGSYFSVVVLEYRCLNERVCSLQLPRVCRIVLHTALAKVHGKLKVAAARFISCL